MTRPPQGTGLIAASVCVHDDHPSAASYSGQSDSSASSSHVFLGDVSETDTSVLDRRRRRFSQTVGGSASD